MQLYPQPPKNFHRRIFLFRTMSSFNSLPDEILYNIFKRVSRYCLRECRKTCRSWYLPALSLYIKTVTLISNRGVESLIQYMDEYPAHVNLIKQLEIKMGNSTACSPLFEAKCLERLFTRTLNIKELYIEGGRKLKKSQIHKSIAKACPKLERLECPDNEDFKLYNNLIDELHEQLINLRLDYTRTKLKYKFSRLQELFVEDSTYYNNCNRMLELFNQEFTLQKLNCNFDFPDTEGFFEEYMESKTEEERNTAIEKMAKLGTLFLSDTIFCLPSLSFIAQHFTGLNQFQMTDSLVRSDDDTWEEEQLNFASGEFMDFLCGMKQFYVHLNRMFKHDLDVCLETIIDKFYNQLPPQCYCSNNILTLTLKDDGLWLLDDDALIAMESKKISHNQVERRFEVFFQGHRSVAKTIKSVLSKQDISTLQYSAFCERRDVLPAAYLPVLQEMLEVLPNVRDVDLSVPGHQYNFPKELKQKQFPQVKHLILNSNREVNRMYIWDGCLHMFPGIKKLTLRYFSGMLKVNIKQYQIFLKGIELDVLTLDVSPILLKSYRSKSIDHHTDQHNYYFFILYVETKTCKRLYRVSFRDLSATEIDEAYLGGLTGNEKFYLKAHISVDKIKYITMVLYQKVTCGFYAIKTYLDRVPRETIQANLCIE